MATAECCKCTGVETRVAAGCLSKFVMQTMLGAIRYICNAFPATVTHSTGHHTKQHRLSTGTLPGRYDHIATEQLKTTGIRTFLWRN